MSAFITEAELPELLGQVLAHERALWRKEVESLKQRIAELESRPAMSDAGVWSPREYHRGEFVTCGGSLWCSTAPTTHRPGGGEKSWRLAVKRGRDRTKA